MAALRLFLRDVLRGTIPSYEKDPDSVAYYVSADGDRIIRARGQRKVMVPLTQMKQDEVRASEVAAVLLQAAVSKVPPMKAYSYAEAVQLMADTLHRRGLRLAHVLADHKWRNGLPVGTKAVAAAAMPERVALGLSTPETLGIMPVGEDGRIGLLVHNLEGIVPVEILPN